MADEKRMIDNYEVKNAIHIGGKEVILAEDLASSEPCMVCNCTWDNPLGVDIYDKGVVGTDYLEAMTEFLNRVASEVQQIRDQRADRGVTGESLTATDCIPGSTGAKYEGQLIVIRPEKMVASARSMDTQLLLATGGNGCNKKRAEIILAATRNGLEESLAHQPSKEDISFASFMENWLEQMRSSAKRKEIRWTTFGGYQFNVERRIVPYFQKRGILLRNLTADDINTFYDEMLKTVKATTVIHYHNNIRKALSNAEMFQIIRRLKRPKLETFRGKFLKQAEVVKVFEAAQGHKLELGIILGAFYGLRRGEVVGLKWDAIDFDTNTIMIEHTVTTAKVDGKTLILAEDTTKTNASHRSLPLVPEFRAKLLAVRQEQERLRDLCGRSYCKKDAGYIYTDPLGNRIKAEYLTRHFPQWMVRNGFRRLRYHDLRHSCASLLLAAGVTLKEIQEWLGHSDFAITANTYAHLEVESKRVAASSMTWIQETPLARVSHDADEPPARVDTKESEPFPVETPT